jgi:hypothetical protein
LTIRYRSDASDDEIIMQFVTTSWKRMPTTKTQDLNYVQETRKSSNKPKSKAHRPCEMSSTMIFLLCREFWRMKNSGM